MLSVFMGLPGGSEMIIIAAVFLFLIVGAKKLPELARSVGTSVVEFKRGFKEVKEPLDEAENKSKETATASEKDKKGAPEEEPILVSQREKT